MPRHWVLNQPDVRHSFLRATTYLLHGGLRAGCGTWALPLPLFRNLAKMWSLEASGRSLRAGSHDHSQHSI